MQSVAPAPEAPAQEHDRREHRAGWPAVAEGVALAAAPLLAVWPLRVQLWSTPTMIDPYLHTAIIQHGRDLLERSGTTSRQFARAGFVVPGRLFDAAFGDIGGYLAFRYVLALIALVPAYLLFRRLGGRAAGAVAAAAVLANPVLLQAWGSDYPDSSAVSYLTAGTCCLVMPAGSARRRAGWVVAGGVGLTLALHSQFVCLPLIGALVAVHGVAVGRHSIRTALVHLALLAGTAVLVTAVLIGLANLLFGQGDILQPTWAAFHSLRTPQSVRTWHSSTNRWALGDPYLLVPPTVVLSWAVLSLRRRPPAAEITVGLAAALQILAYYYLQFGSTTWTLENYFFLSMLWPAVVLLGAFVVVRVARPVLARPRWAWLIPTAVLLCPLGLHPLAGRLTFRIGWIALALLVGLLATAVVIRLTGPRLPAAGALAGAVLLVAGTYVLLTGADGQVTYRPGQVHYPAPHYADVIATPYQRQLDDYSVASQLHRMVPGPARPGVPLLLWRAPDPGSHAMDIATAQYGWAPNTLSGKLPEITASDARRIRQRHPDYLVLLARTEAPFTPAVAALRGDGFRPAITAAAALHHGAVTVFVRVVRLEY